MSLAREIHEQILMDLISPPGKRRTRGVGPPFGMLVRAPGARPEYRIVSQDERFEEVPDFPQDRVGPTTPPRTARAGSCYDTRTRPGSGRGTVISGASVLIQRRPADRSQARNPGSNAMSPAQSPEMSA